MTISPSDALIDFDQYRLNPLWDTVDAWQTGPTQGDDSEPAMIGAGESNGAAVNGGEEEKTFQQINQRMR